jgi:hypothetical protein
MGDCVSIIVLYNYNAVADSYDNARGCHGLGNAQVINMAAMLAGVPDLALTQVIIIPGSLQQSDYAREANIARVQAGSSAEVSSPCDASEIIPMRLKVVARQ